MFSSETDEDGLERLRVLALTLFETDGRELRGEFLDVLGELGELRPLLGLESGAEILELGTLRLGLDVHGDLDAADDEVSDGLEVLLQETARGERRRTDAQTARHHGGDVARHGVLVARNVRELQDTPTLEPSTPIGRKSSNARWLSVPPETSLTPCSTSRLAMACMFFMTCCWYALNSGLAACFSATARPEMVWLCGPPWRPGKTAKLILSSKSYIIGLPFLSVPFWPLRKKIIAPRGPRRDLCVVVVTTSA